METLSTTTTHQVSSLLPKSFLSTSNSTNPLLLPLKPPLPPPSTTNTTTNLLSTKSNHHPGLKPFPTFTPSPHPPLLKPTPQTHRKAATGYAAALLDVACCDGALGVVARDARRVKRVVEAVLGDERVEGGKKGEVVRRVVESSGGVYAKLVVLVRMLVGKGKVGVVGEVMEEFERLWEELCGVSTERVSLVKDKKGGRGSFVY